MAKRKREAVAEPQPTDSLLSSPDGSTVSSPKVKRAKAMLVEEANALSAEDFQARYVDHVFLSHGLQNTARSEISLQYAKQLRSADFNACFDLIETTSRGAYETSSWGWKPQRKRREMKEKEMRYFLVWRSGTTSPVFEGFLSCMLTHDSSPVVPVLYVYEIHLTEQARGRGLGKHLMTFAEDLARKVGVDKVMLTCFESNIKAHDFYLRLGYTRDACSPGNRRTRNKLVKPDYVIMSREVQPEP